ncbi:hypothetical protein PV327_011583 [Microctonus hyperodae]|uniref:Uncharacterized protein n=1 Tax=Microctonus hyperodae TaxID=165561 RepID=A0AA39C2J1_MICHY|nr:hypothetical protein PV327_011583 [Microctonus hyperodae]
MYTECLNFLRTDNLQHLKLSCHLKFEHSISMLDAVKKILLNAPRLETLHLSNIPISIQEINKISTLKSLRIDMNNFFDRPVKKFNFSNLESIHLTIFPDANDEFIKRIVKDCKKLCNVEIFVCNLVTMKGLIPITKLPGLRHFGASEVNDEVFDKLSHLETFCCPTLNLSRNNMKARVFNFFRRSPNLKSTHVCIGDDYGLFDEYAREYGIILNRDGKYYRSCFCGIDWKKQFNN